MAEHSVLRRSAQSKAALPSDVWQRLELVLERFEDAWRRQERPSIEDYLRQVGPGELHFLLAELVHADLDYRLRAGEAARVEDYLSRFPQLREDSTAALDLVLAEYDLRQRRGEHLDMADYLRRFPQFADALRQLPAATSALPGTIDEEQTAGQRTATPSKDTDAPSLPATIDERLLPSSARLVGEYELLGALGSGGMGEVYKARHRRLGKLVALKLLPADTPISREMAARFHREMRAVGELDHPNVVEAHDAGEQSGIVYLAMKLIDGVDLERLVKQRCPLPIAEACELIRQAALGLEYLHARGLIHRDVKPSNLMRTPEGTVKLLDLGLARWGIETRVEHNLTGSGRVVGTPDYLAPEQIESAAEVDARADLYGLGGTLFYLLTGRPPFAEQKSLIAKLDAHRFLSPPDVRTLRPEVPAELAALLQRLLAKKPQERLASAAEVASALAPFTAALPTPSPQTPVSVPRPGRQRWPVWLAVVGGLAVLGLLFAIVGRDGRPPQSETTAPTPTAAVQPMRLVLEVLHRPAADRFLRPGLLGEEAYETRFGDAVTVKARLRPPGYCFVLAFRPDGKVESLFPDGDDQTPPQKASLGADYVLNDGTGLEAFAVVASSQPLPSFKEWWSPCGNCPWSKSQATPGMVWRADGGADVQDLYATDRGKPEVMTGRQAIEKLTNWLRQTPGIEKVQVLGLTVEPKENR